MRVKVQLNPPNIRSMLPCSRQDVKFPRKFSMTHSSSPRSPKFGPQLDKHSRRSSLLKVKWSPSKSRLQTKNGICESTHDKLTKFDVQPGKWLHRLNFQDNFWLHYQRKMWLQTSKRFLPQNMITLFILSVMRIWELELSSLRIIKTFVLGKITLQRSTLHKSSVHVCVCAHMRTSVAFIATINM